MDRMTDFCREGLLGRGGRGHWVGYFDFWMVLGINTSAGQSGHGQGKGD